MTPSGQPVLKGTDGFYRYAEVSKDYQLVPSDIIVREDENDIFCPPEKLQRAAEKARGNYSDKWETYNHDTNGQNLFSVPTYKTNIGRYPGSIYPTRGDVNALVILVEFMDVSFSLPDNEIESYFQRMLNQKGFNENNSTGSARDWFDVASGCVFSPNFDVIGPVCLPHKRSYYGHNEGRTGYEPRAYEMLPHAIDILLDEGLDFSKFDNDGDGIVDSVFIFFAGYGEASSWIEDTVWPHSASLSQILGSKGYPAGEVFIDTYACTNELTGYEGTVIDGIGTFIHEYSHVLGLPDLYNTSDMTVEYTPGTWSVLDSGPYNNSSRTPPTYSIFERFALGWTEPEDVTLASDLELLPLIESNQGYIIPTLCPNEFYLLENRQKTGWDEYLPGHGMLIWHIDYDEEVWNRSIINNNPTHQHVDLIEASGRIDRSSIGLKCYPFPGLGNVSEISDRTSPSILPWYGLPLKIDISEITETEGTVTAKVGYTSCVDNFSKEVNSTILIQNNKIVADGEIKVYDIMGRLVSSGFGNVDLTTSGIYIVLAKDKKFKIQIM